MSPATVLLIDNDEDSVTIYSMILEHHGYRVLHAGDGESGLRLAREARPDLVISELFLTRLTEPTVAEMLRSDERTAHLPLILLDSISAYQPEVLDRLQRCTRLTKPCEPSRLLGEVERLLASV
jgi:CheY-like chemotaxis protein